MRHACQGETRNILNNLPRSFILINFHFGRAVWDEPLAIWAQPTHSGPVVAGGISSSQRLKRSSFARRRGICDFIERLGEGHSLPNHVWEENDLPGRYKAVTLSQTGSGFSSGQPASTAIPSRVPRQMGDPSAPPEEGPQIEAHGAILGSKIPRKWAEVRRGAQNSNRRQWGPKRVASATYEFTGGEESAVGRKVAMQEVMVFL